MKTILALALSTLFTSTATAAPLTNTESAKVRRVMERYVASWLAGDADAVMRLLTDDSVLIPNEKPPLIGKTALRNYWFPPGTPTLLSRFTTTSDQITGSGDVATVHGMQIIEWSTAGERWRTHGNYLTVLRKTAHGWRIAIQMAGNTDAERIP